MPDLLLPRRLSQQPLWTPKVDWRDQLTDGLLVALHTGQGIPFCAVQRKLLTPNATPAYMAGTPGGLARKYSNATANMDRGSGFLLPEANGGLGIERSYSWLVVLRTTETTSGDFFWSWGGNGGTNYAGLRGAGAGTSIQISWGGGSNQIFSGVPNWADGQLHTIGVSTQSVSSPYSGKVYIDGKVVAEKTTSFTVFSGYSYLGLGGLNRNSSELPTDCEIVGLYMWDRALTDVEMSVLGTDPLTDHWQVYAPPTRRVFFGFSGAAALAGNAQAQASGSGALTTQSQVAGGMVQVSTGTGTMSSTIAMVGSATLTAQAGGDPTFSISLAGAALQEALAQASASTGIDLLGGVTQSAQASGTLTGDTSLSGGATQQAATIGEITVVIALDGHPIAQALAAANLTAGGEWSGAAQASAQMVGAVLTRIDVAGNPQAFVSGAGSLSTILSVIGAVVQTNSATGQLSVAITLDGHAFGEALMQGDPTFRIALDGASVQQALATGALTVTPAGFQPSTQRQRRVAGQIRVHRVAAQGRVRQVSAHNRIRRISA